VPCSAVHDDVCRADPASLLGAWRNTDGTAGGIRWLVLSEHEDGLRLRALGAGRPEPYDWGETGALGYAATPSGTEAWAFTATYDNGFRCVRASAYLRRGLLVVTTYHAFPGAGWPVPYWTREFFHRDAEPAAPSTTAGPARDLTDGATASLGPWQLDPGPLVGLWRNVDAGASRLSSVRIEDRSGYLVLRPHGVWSPRRHDWHLTVGRVFADDVRTTVASAFIAHFELATGRVDMAGYLERRLLTIETASTLDDANRSPFFIREHFYPS
jgi:hypothetical protein